jgi:hypothetical protein
MPESVAVRAFIDRCTHGIVRCMGGTRGSPSRLESPQSRVGTGFAGSARAFLRALAIRYR